MTRKALKQEGLTILEVHDDVIVLKCPFQNHPTITVKKDDLINHFNFPNPNQVKLCHECVPGAPRRTDINLHRFFKWEDLVY